MIFEAEQGMKFREKEEMQYSTLTIRLQLNPDFDRRFPRSKSLILTDMHMYKRFGARKSSIEIGVELQSYR